VDLMERNLSSLHCGWFTDGKFFVQSYDGVVDRHMLGQVAALSLGSMPKVAQNYMIYNVPACRFCLLRGLHPCECSKTMRKRVVGNLDVGSKNEKLEALANILSRFMNFKNSVEYFTLEVHPVAVETKISFDSQILLHCNVTLGHRNLEKASKWVHPDLLDVKLSTRIYDERLHNSILRETVPRFVLDAKLRGPSSVFTIPDDQIVVGGHIPARTHFALLEYPSTATVNSEPETKTTDNSSSTVPGATLAPAPGQDVHGVFSRPLPAKSKYLTLAAERRLKCPHCTAIFPFPAPLKTHIAAVHNSHERPFKCPSCNHRANRKGDLNKHVRTVHEKLKKHFCPVCGMPFAQRSNFQAHMIKKHAGHDSSQGTL